MFGINTYKKLLTGLSLAAARRPGASCAKIENGETAEEPIPVSFSTYGLRPQESKADASYVAPGGDFAAGSQIAVYGYYHDDSTWDTDTDNIPDFMYNQLVTKQSDGTWSYSPVKYWPNEFGSAATSTGIDRLSFWGYYPRGAANLNLYKPGTTTAFDNDSPGIPKVTFTQSEDPDHMIDLMFCEPLKNLYKSQGHIVEGDEKHYGFVSDGEITLKFKHALALVEFEIVEGTGAEVYEIGLTKIKKTGTCADPTTYQWTGQTDSYDYSDTDLSMSSAVVLRLLAIPQDIDPDATFSIRYDITFASSDPDHQDPILYSGNTGSAKLFKTGTGAYGVSSWEAGKHYIYRITAGFERIEFEEIIESADDWTFWTDPDDSTNHEIDVR